MTARSYATAAAGGALLLTLSSATLVGLAGAAASAAASTTPSPTAAAHPTTVDLSRPQDLPFGDPPRAAYLNTSTQDGLIHRPGKAPLRTGWRRGVRDLVRVRGGYTITVLDRCVRYLTDDGHRRNLVRLYLPHYVKDAVASGDGRFIAITVGDVNNRHHEQVIVRRISDDRLVARHAFTTPVVVTSFTGSRALLSTAAFGYRPYLPHVLTRWWNLRTGRLRLIDDAGHPGPGYDYKPSPADLTAGQVALLRGDHHRVVPLSGRAGQAWRTGSHEWVASWSPDDRYVVTETVSTDPSEPGIDAYTVRRARGGAVVTRLRGPSNLESWPGAVWEDPSTFVFGAGYDCSGAPGEGYGCPSGTTVRCTVHGTCDQVTQPPGMKWTQERRVPAS